MQETQHLLSSSSSSSSTPKFPNYPSLPSKPATKSPNYPSKPKLHTHFPSLSTQPNTIKPKSPQKDPHFPSLSAQPNTPSRPKLPNHDDDGDGDGLSSSFSGEPNSRQELPPDFHAKLIYLDSLGLDFLSLIESHPPLLHAPLATLTAAADFLLSPAAAALSPADLRRAAVTCPEILTLPVASRLGPALAFLLREARVPHSALPRAISRRPRLLALPVRSHLRPTLLFLHSIGVHSPHLHVNLLTSSVEDKLLPRIHFFQNLGFSHRDAVSLFRRFPQLFCYSISENYEPKLDYFVVEMGRDLRELKEFPQYFSFSLENRIKPRHRSCMERGVCFPLPVLLKTSNARFRERLEVCCETSMPVKRSPLWCTDSDIDIDLLLEKSHK